MSEYEAIQTRLSRRMGVFVFVMLLLRATVVHADELEELEHFFHATGGKTQWKIATGWLTQGSNYCQWYGVTCTNRTLHTTNYVNSTESITAAAATTYLVTAIELPGNRLAGFLPQTYFDGLPFLEVLDLHDNAGFHGGGILMAPSRLRILDWSETGVRGGAMVPSGLEEYAATTLQVLKISSHRYAPPPKQTTLPALALARLTNLQILELPRNHMFGSLVNDDGLANVLGRLSQLKTVDLSHNALYGLLPTFQSPQLEHVALNHNQFMGTIPNNMDYGLMNLRTLLLHDNQLEGPLPTFSNTVGLRRISLQNNFLTGPIPINFLLNTIMSNESKRLNSNSTTCVPIPVVTIQLQSNRLNGLLPETLAQIPTLNLDITRNPDLLGPLPSMFCKQSTWMDGQVAALGCDGILCPSNTFHPDGRASVGYPCSQCPLNDTTTLGRTECGSLLYGSRSGLDNPVEQEVRILALLYVATTQDSSNGWLHNSGWSQLDDILLHNPRLPAGHVPSHVEFNSIDACQFYGVLCNAKGQVQILTLHKNRLVGTIPDELFLLPALESVDFSENRISVRNWAPLQHAYQLRRLKLSRTAVGASLSVMAVAARSSVEELWLDGCDDIGVIPSALYRWTSLHTLHLENSGLVGSLSPDLRQLSNLKQYVLSSGA